MSSWSHRLRKTSSCVTNDHADCCCGRRDSQQECSPGREVGFQSRCTVFESLRSCLAGIRCLHRQAFGRCCSGGASIPASCGSWWIVFRERVLKTALIGVAQWESIRLTTVERSTCCSRACRRWAASRRPLDGKPDGHGFESRRRNQVGSKPT